MVSKIVSGHDGLTIAACTSGELSWSQVWKMEVRSLLLVGTKIFLMTCMYRVCIKHDQDHCQYGRLSSGITLTDGVKFEETPQ